MRRFEFDAVTHGNLWRCDTVTARFLPFFSPIYCLFAQILTFFPSASDLRGKREGVWEL